MIINTNTAAQVAAHNLQVSETNLSKSLARLSSGSKLVSPADDAAGTAISSRLDAQIRRLQAAKNNIGNAISFTQTQDGYLKKVVDAMNRMSELAMMAQDVIKSDSDRALYQQEYMQLADFILSTANKEFNGVSLFNGMALPVIVDDTGMPVIMAGIPLAAIVAPVLAGNVSTIPAAQTTLANVKSTFNTLSQFRAGVGAYQARFTAAADQLTVSMENLSAATSRIKDVDIAEESTEYAKQNILVQSGTAMLAQANAVPQTALKLLQ